jgi:hypothetical protein
VQVQVNRSAGDQLNFPKDHSAFFFSAAVRMDQRGIIRLAEVCVLLQRLQNTLTLVLFVCNQKHARQRATHPQRQGETTARGCTSRLQYHVSPRVLQTWHSQSPFYYIFPLPPVAVIVQAGKSRILVHIIESLRSSIIRSEK